MNYNISEEDWRVVEVRLESMPEEMRIGILSKVFTKEELMSQVKQRTEVGYSYASMQLRFIRWLLKETKIE